MTERVFRADIVAASPSRLFTPGEFVVDAGGGVAHVGPCRRSRSVRRSAIVPGLVNAHVHLQLPALRRRRRRFLPWVGEVMRLQRRASDEDVRARVLQSLRSLLAGGTTAVGEIDGNGVSADVLAGCEVAGRCYQELTGFLLDARGARQLLERRARPGTRRCPAGWSPHAPYSVSPALFRAAARGDRPLMVHVAEIAEEIELLQTGRGPLRDLLRSLRRWPPRFVPPRMSPVRWLDHLGVLGPRCTLVHAQHLLADDLQTIAASGSPIVVCPGTIDYFGRPPPAVPAWLAAGVCVALGTDSRASNDGLDMRREMSRARQLWPALTPASVFAMATTSGGRALCRPALGRLRRGGRADFAVVDLPFRMDATMFLDLFTRGELPPPQTFVAGAPWSLRS